MQGVLAVVAATLALAGAGCRSALPACSDGARNGAETDIDCGGGACRPCEDGRGCGGAIDCASGRCTGHVCGTLMPCSDGIKDGDESDVDCGGACAPCEDRRACRVAADCKSGDCEVGVCREPVSCSDGRKDGRETGVDCGGGDCMPCPTGEGCAAGSDCKTGICTSHVCQAMPCRDGVRDGDETDVDCGGRTCPPCSDGDHCLVRADCVSSNCDQGVCQPRSMSCNPGYIEDKMTGVCVCDPVTCNTCCNPLENNLCGITKNPGANNCGGRGQMCFLCDIKTPEECVHGTGDDYCARTCDTDPCGGCCAQGIKLKLYCLHGDEDFACGKAGDICRACPQGQRCVNHACTGNPDGGG